MTNDPLKELARVVLVNDERLTVLSDILNSLIEPGRVSGDAPGVNRLRSLMEQLEASSRALDEERGEIWKAFGLE
jgi:hypothetical protein